MGLVNYKNGVIAKSQNGQNRLKSVKIAYFDGFGKIRKMALSQSHRNGKLDLTLSNISYFSLF